MTKFNSPLPMDNATLLFWAEYMLGPKTTRVATYDNAVEEYEELRELAENQTMLENMVAVLKIDAEYMEMQVEIAKTRQRTFFGQLHSVLQPQIRRLKAELAEIDTRRQAAYDDYEMFRKLIVDAENPDLYRITLR